MNNAEKRHVELVAEAGCVVCRRLGHGCVPGHIHHVAEGSGLRSWFATACLCYEHHEGATGIHGMGTKAFIRAYRLPGDSEYGLLVWVNEDLARFGIR